MAEKGIGSKILGIFVEKPDAPEADEASPPADAGKSPADLIAELAQASAAAPGAPAPAPAGLESTLAGDLASASAAGGAPMDFDAIFKDAGMDAADLDRVKKAEDLLKSLPEATPVEVKRQIVEASLKAFGFDIAKIISASQVQQKALDTYVRINESGTAKAIEQAQQEIAALNEKIAALRTDIGKRTAILSTVTGAAQARKQQVQKVLDFFGMSSNPASKA
jgi:Holliday junction resolvasome RuvABC endonuclease subunit